LGNANPRMRTIDKIGFVLVGVVLFGLGMLAGMDLMIWLGT